jgi:hypothetical protein
VNGISFTNTPVARTLVEDMEWTSGRRSDFVDHVTVATEDLGGVMNPSFLQRLRLHFTTPNPPIISPHHLLKDAVDYNTARHMNRSQNARSMDSTERDLAFDGRT